VHKGGGDDGDDDDGDGNKAVLVSKVLSQ